MTTINELNNNLRQRSVDNATFAQNDILRDIKQVLMGIKESLDSMAEVLRKHENY